MVLNNAYHCAQHAAQLLHLAACSRSTCPHIPRRADVLRSAAQVVEAACGIGHQLLGARLENVAADIDCYSAPQPLGVCGGICPFNFPAMVPLWMFPVAIAAGNTYVLKPSEKVLTLLLPAQPSDAACLCLSCNYTSACTHAINVVAYHARLLEHCLASCYPNQTGYAGSRRCDGARAARTPSGTAPRCVPDRA